MVIIQKIALAVHGIEKLRDEARTEGYDFVETLFNEWESGKNRFEKHGEVLMACFDQENPIAVGGLTIDPFASSPKIGRIRRVYVRPAWRNKGIGARLVSELISASRKSFHTVRLRAESPDAARLYERLGFSPIDDENASHRLVFDSIQST
jgi:GNAT superfamily N-acetyltransferase